MPAAGTEDSRLADFQIANDCIQFMHLLAAKADHTGQTALHLDQPITLQPIGLLAPLAILRVEVVDRIQHGGQIGRITGYAIVPRSHSSVSSSISSSSSSAGKMSSNASLKSGSSSTTEAS